ncbi:unnamed protein product, partial [Closterium sp. NIES-53]
FYHPTSRCVFPSHDFTFDESVPFYHPLPGPAPVLVAVDLGAARGAASKGAASGDATSRGDASRGAAFGGAEPGGAGSEGAEPEGVEPGGAEPQGAASSGGAAGAGVTRGTATTGPGGDRTRATGAVGSGGVAGAGAGDPMESGATGAGGSGAGSTGVVCTSARGAGVGGFGLGGAGAGGAGVVDPGGTVRPRPYFVPLLQQVLGTPSSPGLTLPLLCPPPDQSQPPLQPASPLPAPSPYTEQSVGLTEHRKPESRPISPVCTARRVPHLRPSPLPSTHAMTLHPSSVPLCVPLPALPEASLPEVPDPQSDCARANRPTVSRLLTSAVSDPSFKSTAASALFAELLDFVATCHLEYTTALVAESASASPPSVEGECALCTDVLEDRQEDFECLAAAGVDYFQTFSPTPKMTTLWVLLHVTAQRDYELHSLDLSTAFLQGSLHKEIWLCRPPGFTGSFPACTQWSLRWPVYGLRQTPREWHDTLGTTLAALGFAPTTADTSLRDTLALTWVLQRLGFQFSSPQPTPLSTSHSLSPPPSDETVEPSGSYPELVGCLMCLMTCTIPDLAYPLSLLAHYVAPGRHRKGYTFSLGSGSISWRSTCLSSVLSSSCEAEIYAGAMAAQELCWLTYLLTDLGEQSCSPPVLCIDNKAMIALCQEHKPEHRLKHIALRYFLVQELQQRGQLRLAYVATRANTPDIFTKALPPSEHQRFSTLLGLLTLLFLIGLVTTFAGLLCATPHSSFLRLATAPFQTLHLDVWGPAPAQGAERERYFLLVVEDYFRYTMVIPLAKKSEVTSTLIRWLLAIEGTPSHRVSYLHSDCGGEFRSGILRRFCGEQGISQSWTLPESPQQNGVTERRIGLVMGIARTSMNYARSPHFLWPYAVRYAAHQLNLQPRVSRPEASPTSRWTGSLAVGSSFCVWGCLALVRDTSADKLLARAIPCVFLGFPVDSPDYAFYHPPLHHFLDSRDVRFDESVSYYTWYPYQCLSVPPPLLLAPSPPPAPAPPVPPPPPGPTPSGVSHATHLPSVACKVASPSPQSSSQSPQQPSALPRQVIVDSGGVGAGGADTGGARSGGVHSRDAGAGGASLGGARAGGAGTGGASSGGAGARGAGSGGAGSGGVSSRVAGAGGAGTGGASSGGARAGGTGTELETLFLRCPLSLPTATTCQLNLLEQQDQQQQQQQLLPHRQLFPPVNGLQTLSLPSSSPARSPYLHISLAFGPTFPPLDDSPAVWSSPWSASSPPIVPHYRVRPCPPRDRPSSPVSDLLTALFCSSHCHSPPLSVLPSPPLSSHPVSPTPISGYYRAARPVVFCVLATLATDSRFSPSSVSALTTTVAEFAATSHLDCATRVVPAPPIHPLSVEGEFSLGCDVLEDRQSELQYLADASPSLCPMLLSPEGDPDALDILTLHTYPQAVKRPLGSSPVFKARYVARGFSQREGVDFFQTFAPTLKMTTLRFHSFLLLVYVDDLVFATADRAALAEVKSELQKRHTCTNLGELQRYLSLKITRDRAACTVTLTQSHLVQQVLRRFELQFSTTQPTPLSIDQRLTGPFPDEPFKSSGPYAELVGCLVYLMACTWLDLAFPLSVLSHFVATGRHCPVHWTAAVRVAKYLATTSSMGRVLGGTQPVELTGHCDSSYADDVETQRLTQGYCFSLGVGAVSRRSTRSSSVASSSAEAEIYAGAMAA